MGWRFLYSLIQEDRWFISEQCPEALDAIPALEYDTEKGDEDILKTDHLYDDIGDELRYGLVDMLAPRAKSQEEKDREKVEAAKPGMERELLRYKLTMDRNSSLVRAEERRPSHWD